MATKTSRVTTRKRTAVGADGHWTGDVGAFVDWCIAATDLETFKAALAGVPPNHPWSSLVRSLPADSRLDELGAQTAGRVASAESQRRRVLRVHLRAQVPLREHPERDERLVGLSSAGVPLFA